MDFEEIRNYWEGRATDDDSVQSTTQDVFLREIELKSLSERLGRYAPTRVADVGCGDGRTTIGLARTFPDSEFLGFDYSSSMVVNAMRVRKSHDVSNASFEQSDITRGLDGFFDLVYTTRCLINLPSWELQQHALRNIHAALPPNGVYLMVENFIEGHASFNQVRKDYGLAEIPVRDHNLFFERAKLLEFIRDLFVIEEEVNISSTYYLVSRVIYSRICVDDGATPDYFDPHHRYAAGLPFCGEYGPVRLIAFRKK
jgi:ubiquinone/menaquinone biosynthesis C-methylase UbiE